MTQWVFHIGHHKTATTWLQKNYFSQHPQLNMVTPYIRPWQDDLLSYLIGSSQRTFDETHCREILKSKLKHVNQDLMPVVSAERLSGHAFSGGYDSLSIAERIHSCTPDAKIIIAIRNQVDMIRSMYIQLIKEGYVGRVADILNNQRWKSTAFSLDFLEYDVLISKYIDLFSAEHVLVLVYEDLAQDPNAYNTAVSEFLNIEPLENHDLSKENRSPQNHRIRAKRLMNHYRVSELHPFPLIKLPKAMMKRLAKWLSVFYSKEDVLSAQEIEFIQNHYRNSNQRLKDILHRKLSAYQ